MYTLVKHGFTPERVDLTDDDLALILDALDTKLKDITDNAECFTDDEYVEALALWHALRTKLEKV